MNQGFGNIFCSEAIEGALPNAQNAPKRPPLGLFAEQISGSAFTQNRSENLHSWVYRTSPSVAAHTNLELASFQMMQALLHPLPPAPFRWSSPKFNHPCHNFFQSLVHLASSGDQKHVFWYHVHLQMSPDYFFNYDGELLFIPYLGQIRLQTEFGCLECAPGQIVVIPRGIGFKILAQSPQCFGYLLENGGFALSLPELGLMGANGLAHPRHFYYPNAAYESKASSKLAYIKSRQFIWMKNIEQSPLNVLAWQGNYLPYFYDTKHYNAINTVSFDHPDPSIFTLLSSKSNHPGIASLDFVIFPERLSVARHSFRLPYFHRNIMNELMGLIRGEYDAKGKEFCPGGVSVHNCFTPHGPDFASWHKESQSDDQFIEIKNSLAFMLESNQTWEITESASQMPELQINYADCWRGFPSAKFNLD